MAGKKVMRREIMNKMQAISIADKTRFESCLFHKLFETSLWQNAQTVAVTMATPMEIQTDQIMQQAWREGKTILVPTTLPDWQMKFSEYHSDTIVETNDHGIREPVNGEPVSLNEIDLIIVPGLGFSTATGYRLGFGGGYYDRFLEHYNGHTVSLALPMQTFSEPEWPTYPHDIRIQTIITCESEVDRGEANIETTISKN